MLSSLALFLVTAQDPKIDFECKATSLKTVIARLAEQTRSKLEVAGPVADQIIFIRVKDAKVEDLKAKIATAMAATWVKRDNKEILERLSSQQEAIYKDQIAKRAKAFEDEFKTRRAQVQKPFDAKALAIGLLNLGPEPRNSEDPQGARQYFTRQSTLFAAAPLARLANRIILSCRLEDLASVGPYERRLFRLDPTKMQSGFDKAKYQEALKLYAAEQSAWIEAAKGVDFGNDSGGRMVSDPRNQIDKSPDIKGFGLAFIRGDMTGLGMVNLTEVSDQPGTGWPVVQVNLAGPERAFLNGEVVPESPGTPDPLVNLSTESRLFNDGIAAAFSQRTGAPVTPEMANLLANPDKIDPLSFLPSDILTDYSKAHNVNVVASLCDKIFSWTSFAGTRQAPRLGAMMRSLTATNTIDIDEKDGWAVITPANRYEEEMTFTPRVPMGELMRSVVKNGDVDMSEYATFAFRSKRVSRSGLSEYYLMLHDRSFGSTMDHVDWNCLRLYGSLSEQQRKVVEEKGNIPLSGMSSEQKKIFQRMIYNSELGSETMGPGGTYSRGNAIEPTETYGKGLPAGSVLTGRATNAPTFVAYSKGADGKIKPMRTAEPYTIAYMELEVMGKPETMKSYGISGFVGYAPGKTKTVILRLLLEPKIWRETSMTFNEYDRSATPVAWDKLDDATVKSIRASMEQVKAQKASQTRPTKPPR